MATKHRYDRISISSALDQQRQHRAQLADVDRRRSIVQDARDDGPALLFYALVILAIALAIVRYALPDPPRMAPQPAASHSPAERQGNR